MRFLWLTFTLLLTLFASACTSKPYPYPLAPADVPVWETPADMPKELYDELQGKIFQYVAESTNMQLYDDLFIHFPDSIGPLPVHLPATVNNIGGRFSHNARYYAYISGIFGEEIAVVDMRQQVTFFRFNVRRISNAKMSWGVAFGPDNRYLIVQIAGDNLVDLVRIDLPSGAFRRLHVSAPLTPWTDLDVAPDGAIVVQCFEAHPNGKVAVYLCLLDAQGRLVRALTQPTLFGQGHPESAGRFTPDGQWIVYDWQHRLYKVSRQGGEPQEIGPCTVRGPVWVTSTHALTPCYVRRTPKCYALYAAALDGSGFYRFGFIPEVCPALRATQEAQKR